MSSYLCIKNYQAKMATAFTFMDLTSGRCAGQLAVTSKCWRLWTHREGFRFSLGHRFGNFNSVGPVVKLCMADVDIKSRALPQKSMWDSLFWKHLEWPWPRNTDSGHLKLRVPMWKLQHEVWEFYRTEAVINQSKFKTHWWVRQRGSSGKVGEALL